MESGTKLGHYVIGPLLGKGGVGGEEVGAVLSLKPGYTTNTALLHGFVAGKVARHKASKL